MLLEEQARQQAGPVDYRFPMPARTGYDAGRPGRIYTNAYRIRFPLLERVARFFRFPK